MLPYTNNRISELPVRVMVNDSPYQVKVLTSFAEFESVRDAWSALQWCPEADIDFISFIASVRPEIDHPVVIVVRNQGQVVTLLAGRVEDGDLPIRFGYKTLWRFGVRRLTIFYGGFMGQSTPEIGAIVIQQLLQLLREYKADILAWNDVRWSSDLHRLLGQIPNRLCRDYLARPVLHWTMAVPASLDEMFEQRMDKKQRYYARRALRMAEKAFPGAIRYAAYSAPADVGTLFEDVLKVARKTYQWGLGVGFQGTGEDRKRLQFEAEKGWLRAYVLYLKAEPVAFWICSVYKETVFLDFTGYDPAFRNHEVGTALFLRMVAEMAAEGVKSLDFGPGSAFYKERFGSANFEEATVCVFRFAFRAVVMNAVRSLATGSMSLGRGMVQRLGVEQRLKRAWRSHLSRTAPAKEAPPPAQ